MAHRAPRSKANGAARAAGGASNRRTGAARKDGAGESYDAFKQFEGKRYTGMKVGRGHHWRYEDGEWVEKKLTPDRWEFRYAVSKRRKGRAPEGSGVPPGTEYHWYILAHQTARKLDANGYATEMVGIKHKLSHKRAGKTSWSASDRAQRKHLIEIFREMIRELEAADAADQSPRRRATKRAA
jgi:hypothetical protein